MKIIAKAKVQALIAAPQSNMTQAQLQIVDDSNNPLATFAMPFSNAVADGMWAERAKDFVLTLEQK